METITAVPVTRRERRAATREKKIKVGVKECTLEDLLFPVHCIKNPANTNSEYSKTVVGLVNGKLMNLNYCSNIYKLVPNKMIFPEIENVLDDNGIQYEKSYSHINHVKFYIEYKITDSRFAYRMKGTNDTICPLLKVTHSYNGLVKYKIIFGYFRFVCTNGLVIAVEQMKEFNLVIIGKHTEAILNSFSELDKMLKNFVENADTIISSITAKYEILGGRWVEKVEDRVTEVLKANKIAMIDNKNFNTLNYILDRIKVESTDKDLNLGYNGFVNDWLIYNSINRYLYSDRNIAAPDARMEKDSKIFEYLLKYPA